MQAFIDFILQTVDGWGYWGIFFLMAVESSFIPLPSEIVIIPAGYLAYQGKMNLAMIIFCGTLGSLAGAFVNYYLALFVGRRFLYKYGKYFFLSEKNLLRSEKFFNTHSSFSTFTGRLIPVIRHLISIPAGLSRMKLLPFCFYTLTGAAIWVSILAFLGYFIGHNEALLREYLHSILAVLMVFILIATVVYVILHKKKLKKMLK